MRGLLVRLLLALAGAAVMLTALEVGARRLGLHAGSFLGPSSTNCVRRSRLLSLDFHPNCTGNLAGTPVQINSLGLRSPELRDDGSQRILAIGDSCTWGWLVGQTDSYPAVLQQLLDVRFGPTRYQVLNAGVPGHTSYQGLVYLRERGLALHPAVVIAGYGFNDSVPSGDIQEQIAREGRLFPLILLDDLLLDNSAAYGWARWRAFESTPTTDLAPRVSLPKFRDNLAEMVALSREHGAKVLLVGFLPPSKMNQYSRALGEVAAAQNVPLLWYEGPRLDILHPTAEGDRAFAARVADQLAADGYVN